MASFPIKQKNPTFKQLDFAARIDYRKFSPQRNHSLTVLHHLITVRLKIILVAFISTFFIFSKSPLNTITIVDQDQVITNISILRKAGFFEEYGDLSDREIFDTIHSIRKKQYTEIFQRPYDPGMELTPIEIAKHDETKLLYTDLEADVLDGNKAYVRVIKSFAHLSNGKFRPWDIREEWSSDEGPIRVSYRTENSEVVFRPDFQNDWLHESVFTICMKELDRKNIRIVFCLAEDGQGYGQDIAIMRLTKEQQKILEKELGWKYSD